MQEDGNMETPMNKQLKGGKWDPCKMELFRQEKKYITDIGI